MRFTLTIELDNDAFQGEGGGAQLATILRDAASDFDELPILPDAEPTTLHDYQGNRVGQYQVG